VLSVPIPASKVQLAIPAKDLARLPPGSSYSRTSGQASLKVGFAGDTIYVEAVCDSLARLVEVYEAQLLRMQSRTENRLKIEETGSVRIAFKWCFIGVLIGSTITILITRKLKK
jgi:hypothetical protein